MIFSFLSTLDIGKLHPLWVHLPIGIYVLFVLLFVYEKKYNSVKAEHSLKIILFLGAVLSSATSISGYLYSGYKGYDASLIFWHKYGGILFSILTWILWYSYQKEYSNKIKLIFTALLFILLLIVGHLGGSLTHGKNYLMSFNNESKIHSNSVTKSFDSLNYFADVIKPILNRNCLSCHQPPMVRGGWDMSNDSSLFAGGKYGSTILPGNINGSELIKRISLPRESAKHMPPTTMPDLVPIEIFLLKHWIKTGAKTDILVSSTDIDENTKAIISAYTGLIRNETENIQLPILPELSDSIIQSLKNEIGIVNRFSTESPLLDVSLIHLRGKSETELQKAFEILIPFNEYIYSLDLSSLNLKSSDLKFILPMKNLFKLNLANNYILDDGIKSLNQLSNLQFLNLYNNPITDNSIEIFTKMTRLKTITLSETKISPAAVQKMIEADKLEINY